MNPLLSGTSDNMFGQVAEKNKTNLSFSTCAHMLSSGNYQWNKARTGMYKNNLSVVTSVSYLTDFECVYGAATLVVK